ncbi:Nramp family divalent metal transporter [Marnyiella aurantia]|uniref:Divalent metal cation transporter MntH n=1 Tax=Marnyiella aurantia TaxID=2758037 RepID=A0A7D7QLG4_9FLAO|nr:Nramp family divalent metal transporter [Marnyiella aurantia]MBA5247345.1 Nramp family divalent metal transporter [Marnyiella aurantia]QMS99105.1 Nramp family divalent metal transporter [Marnyiella aurantia]
MFFNSNPKAWRRERSADSLPEVFSSINIPKNAGFWRKLMAFTGPGMMVAVGYMDPGNWATDIAGGAQFGYTLLSVILISNIFAIILQHLSLKLGIVAERDLAQACRDHFSPTVNFILWVLCEIAIAACDLAEVIGSAIALNLLFGIPLTWGVVITVVDVFLILFLQAKGFRVIESIVAGLIFIILGCFAYEIILSKPDIFPILSGLVPQKEVITNPSMLYIAIGILGATVMPHNLYLHSSIVQTRNYERTSEGKKEAIKFATIDSTVALLLAFFINAAILIVAAATFHTTGNRDVADIHDAHKMLAPILGTTLASIFFAVALLASGQNSTLTGTLAGQIVMEGFLNIRLKPWLRRLVTRLIAVIPALIVTIIYGERGTTDLLLLSQVILSMQLSFAVVPLVMFTGSKLKMGEFANKLWLKILIWIIAFIIIILNLYLLYETFFMG